MKHIFIASLLSLIAFTSECYARERQISPNLFGIFFEDLNYAADGGLYPELVQNRSFEYSPSDVNWNKNPHNNWYYFTAWWLERKNGICTISLESASPLHQNNPHYLRFVAHTAGSEGVGLRNDGFDGIHVKKGEKYDFSIWTRLVDTPQVPMRVTLTEQEKVISDTILMLGNNDWRKLGFTITAGLNADNASLMIRFMKPATIDIDMVSLYPQDTFMGRKNGLRKDLATIIADIKPKFMRFPGGCLSHGDGIANIYDWKRTIGPVEQRRGDKNIWNYAQTFGLGYYEYLQFCEDIGAKPIPVVAAGVSCQNSARTRGTGQEAIPMNEMERYIRDILDLIEYCNGPASSEWGAKRAEAGHPEPFCLEYIGIGNEDHITPEFEERYRMIIEAVKDKYPEIKIIGTSGPLDSGPDFNDGWHIARTSKTDIVDEHYYKDEEWFRKNLDRYERYDRKGPKAYLGEYASRGSKLRNALAEAAYMTSLERNGDVVEFASYAPLLGRIGHCQWNPDLIYFDGKNVYPTVNYYVQYLFGNNAGDLILDGVFNKEEKEASSVIDSTTGDIILKMVNTSESGKKISAKLPSLKRYNRSVDLTVLSGESLDDINAAGKEATVLPKSSRIYISRDFNYMMPPRSLSVIRIKRR